MTMTNKKDASAYQRYAQEMVKTLLGRKIKIGTPSAKIPGGFGTIFNSTVKIYPYKNSYIVTEEIICMDIEALYKGVFEEDSINPPVKYLLEYAEYGKIKSVATPEEIFNEMVDNYIKHEVGHIISINNFLKADPETACERYKKLLDDAYKAYANLPDAIDIESYVERCRLYYDIEIERMANDVFTLSYLDL